MHTLAIFLGLFGSLIWIALVAHDWRRLRRGRRSVILDELLGGRASSSWFALTVLLAVGLVGVAVSLLVI